MSAEPIAAVVADLLARKVTLAPQIDEKIAEEYPTTAKMALDLIADPTVVDATDVYHALVDRQDPIALYEDHACVAPPWEEAAICYRNEHGNVIVQHTNVIPFDPAKPPWKPAERVDWSRVKWRLDTYVWIGGRRGDGRPFPTTGPLLLWQYAIYENGEPADLHWVHLVPQYPLKNWDMAQLVLLGSLNYLNCRNVEVVEPKRPRAEARRIARIGVRVHTINVFPVGKTRRGAKGDPQGSVPLSPVRGHFAHYGACCTWHEPRGLLFGRLEGRFWIPQHARGSRDLGESKPDFKLRAP